MERRSRPDRLFFAHEDGAANGSGSLSGIPTDGTLM
jgi:hypothetical protein